MSVPFYAEHLSEDAYNGWKEARLFSFLPPGQKESPENLAMQIAEIAETDLTEDEEYLYFYPGEFNVNGGLFSKYGLPAEHPDVAAKACELIFSDERFSNRALTVAILAAGLIKDVTFDSGVLMEASSRVASLKPDDSAVPKTAPPEIRHAQTFSEFASFLQASQPRSDAARNAALEFAARAIKAAPEYFGMGAADIFNEIASGGHDVSAHKETIQKMFAENRVSLWDAHWEKHARTKLALPDDASDDDVYARFVRNRFPALAPMAFGG